LIGFVALQSDRCAEGRKAQVGIPISSGTLGEGRRPGCSKEMWYVMAQSYECRILVCCGEVRTRDGNSWKCDLASICCPGHADMQNGLPTSARCHFAGLRRSVTREGRLTTTHLVPCILCMSPCGNLDFCHFGEDMLERKQISLDSLFKHLPRRARGVS
jgi:hypothetical protein